MPSKKIGMSDLLEIVVYPFVMPFDIDLFTSHMVHRTAHLFIANGSIGERCFVAVTAVDFETQKPPSTLSIIAPKWRADKRAEIYADVREFLARSKAIAVCSPSETEDGITVGIEWNGQRSAFAAMKIRDTEGGYVLAQWERVSAGVALPLLPTAPGNLQ
jgi:hypothetical protein